MEPSLGDRRGTTKPKQIDVPMLLQDAFSSIQMSLRKLFIALQHHLMTLIGQLKTRVSVDTLRPLTMFLGITAPGFCLSVGAFTPPIKKIDKSTNEKFKSRLHLNWNFFLTNYVLVVITVSVIIAFLHPSMIFSLVVLYGLWSIHYFLNNHDIILFGGKSLSHTILPPLVRKKTLTVITVIIILWKCLVYTFTCAFISGSIIFLHAVLRDPKHIEKFSADMLHHGSSSGGAGIQSFGSGDSDEDEYDVNNSRSLGGSEVLVERPRTVRESDAV